MEIRIKKIVVFKGNLNEKLHEDKGIDVMVLLSDEQQYLATFYSSQLINQKLNESRKYQWSTNMIISLNYQLPTVTWIVNDMLDSGDFYLAFEKLS